MTYRKGASVLSCYGFIKATQLGPLSLLHRGLGDSMNCRNEIGLVNDTEVCTLRWVSAGGVAPRMRRVSNTVPGDNLEFNLEQALGGDNARRRPL